MKATLETKRPAWKNSFDQSRGYKFLEPGTTVEITGYDENSGRFTAKTTDGWGLNFHTDEASPIEE